MKIPMNWIRDYTAIPTDGAAYTSRMVLTGTGRMMETPEPEAAEAKTATAL